MTEHDQTIAGEIIEALDERYEPGAELVPTSPATLFRTDEPDLIIARAAEVASTLAKVLRTQKGPDGKLSLIANISGKEYVKVEGWELCGTMLGVYAVVEWTKEIPGGWEARAEARTLAGNVVGAAEAICLDDEDRWKKADSYARKSMAQTRAISKALRAPLGFIMTMAGYEATPSEEIPTGAPEPARSREPVRQEGAQPYPIPTSWPKVKDAFRDCDNPDESEALYEAFLQSATYHLYGKLSLKDISSEERKIMLQKAAGAVCWMHDSDMGVDGPFVHFLEDHHRAAWKQVLDGADLKIPDYVPPEPETSAEAEAESYDEEAARLAAELLAEQGRDDA